MSPILAVVVMALVGCAAIVVTFLATSWIVGVAAIAAEFVTFAAVMAVLIRRGVR